MDVVLLVLLFALDLVLLWGLAARMTRFVVGDTLGGWWLRDPANYWAGTREPHGSGWRTKLVSGLECPWCIGFWLAVAATVSLALVGGPADGGFDSTLWRYVAGALTLNYITAQIGVRLGDAGWADEE